MSELHTIVAHALHMGEINHDLVKRKLLLYKKLLKQQDAKVIKETREVAFKLDVNVRSVCEMVHASGRLEPQGLALRSLNEGMSIAQALSASYASQMHLLDTKALSPEQIALYQRLFSEELGLYQRFEALVKVIPGELIEQAKTMKKKQPTTFSETIPYMFFTIAFFGALGIVDPDVLSARFKDMLDVLKGVSFTGATLVGVGFILSEFQRAELRLRT